MKIMMDSMNRVRIATVFVFLGAGGLLADAVEPQYFWDFETVQDGKYAINVGSVDRGRKLRAPERCAGVNGSTACRITGAESLVQATDFAFSSGAFTIDFAFRLDGPVNPREGNALLSYSWSSYGRGSFLVVLRKDGALEANFRRPKSDREERVDFTASTLPLDVAPGVFHAVRVCRTEAGELSIWLDGRLVVSKTGAPSLADIRCEPPQFYPILRLGVNDRDPTRLRAFLKGAIDDVAVYGVALGAPAIRIPDASAERAVNEQLAEDVLFAVAGRPARTGAFRLPDREGKLLGALERAERKFFDNVSTATFEMDEKTICVTVDCPVPPDMAIERSTRSVGSGDGVEIFIKPSEADPAYYQYRANTAGMTDAYRHPTAENIDPSFVTKACATVLDTARGFRVVYEIPRDEIFTKMPAMGDVFRVNFCRVGRTCNQISTWAKVGDQFAAPERFGRVIWGSTDAYWNRRLDSERARMPTLADGESRVRAEDAFCELTEVVRAHAADPAAFAALETAFANFAQRLVALTLAGHPLLVYRPDVWGDSIEPDSNTRPLEEISLTVARNSRAWFGFVVKNLTQKDFIGQVKVFDKEPGNRFGWEGTFGIARKFTTYEAVPTDVGGIVYYDPMAELPMGTLLRLGAGRTAPIWLELDTTGLASGRHTATLYLKRATAGFEILTVPVEVNVIDKDLASVDIRRANYECISKRCLHSPEALRLLNREANGTIQFSDNELFQSTRRADGSFTEPVYTNIDQKIDARLATGLDRSKLLLWFWAGIESSHRAVTIGPKGRRAKIGTPEWDAGMRWTFERFYAHLKEKYGIGPDRLIVYLADEPKIAHDPEDISTVLGKTFYAGRKFREWFPDMVLFSNPGGKATVERDREIFKKMSSFLSILEMHRPGLTPGRIKAVQDAGFKDVWTYSIYCKTTPAAYYRRDGWMNMRDGFSEITTYWHLDQMAGYDGFDQTDTSTPGSRKFVDYGVIYIDYDSGKYMPSRRQFAYDLAYEDMRLIFLLRCKYASDAQKLAELEALIRKAADDGSMSAMDAARQKMLTDL